MHNQIYCCICTAKQVGSVDTGHDADDDDDDDDDKQQFIPLSL